MARSILRWTPSAALGAAGAFLLLLAWRTPWHTDFGAYQRAIDEAALTMDTRAFYAAAHRYATPKWTYADLGYACVAWSILTFAVTALWDRLRPWRTTSRWAVILPIWVVAITSLGLGFIADVFHLMGRDQMPVWADSYGIPLMGIEALMKVLTPVTLLLVAVPPLLRPDRPDAPLLSPPGNVRAIVMWALYAVPLLACAVLIALAWGTGGWAHSVGAALMAWLLLNAVAVSGAPWRT